MITILINIERALIKSSITCRLLIVVQISIVLLCFYMIGYFLQKPEKGRMRVHKLTNVNRAIKHLEDVIGVSHYSYFILFSASNYCHRY